MAVANLHSSKDIKYESYITDCNPEVLTRIYDDQINLAIYKRSVSNDVANFVKQMLQQKSQFSFVQAVDIKQIKKVMAKSLPESDYLDAFLDDIYMLCDMYELLLGVQKIGIRLAVLEHAMCPRFHVDRVGCRLLTTYDGIGTEWLSEDNVDRSKLGSGNKGLPDEESGVYFDKNQINRLNPFDVAIFKGESWPNNEGKGIVHRSPTVDTASRRLLLSLDAV